MKTHLSCAAIVLAFALGSPLTAQSPTPASPSAASETPAPARPSADSDLEPAPDGYSYNPAARRDPFISLMRPVSADRSARQRPQGMEGFLIAEVALKGIVKTSGGGRHSGEKAGFVAIFVGTDNKSYFVREGQRLYDGAVTAIDSTSVTFRQEVTDPLSPVRTRDVKKSLYASEEARR